MRSPNVLFALVLVAALGMKAALRSPPLARKARKASLTGCSNGWYLRPILQPRRMRYCSGRPARDRFRLP